MATGVPILVDAPKYVEGFALGMAALNVGGPEISEFDEAITEKRITPPGLKPTVICAI